MNRLPPTLNRGYPVTLPRHARMKSLSPSAILPVLVGLLGTTALAAWWTVPLWSRN